MPWISLCHVNFFSWVYCERSVFTKWPAIFCFQCITNQLSDHSSLANKGSYWKLKILLIFGVDCFMVSIRSWKLNYCWQYINIFVLECCPRSCLRLGSLILSATDVNCCTNQTWGLQLISSSIFFFLFIFIKALNRNAEERNWKRKIKAVVREFLFVCKWVIHLEWRSKLSCGKRETCIIMIKAQKWWALIRFPPR